MPIPIILVFWIYKVNGAAIFLLAHTLAKLKLLQIENPDHFQI